MRVQNRNVQRLGRSFEEGDYMAIIALQQITIQLKSSLLERLRDAAYDDDGVDLMSLVDAADFGRDKSISTLSDLRQRLAQGEAVDEVAPLNIKSRSNTVESIPASKSRSNTAESIPASLRSPSIAPTIPEKAPTRPTVAQQRTLTPDVTSSGYVSSTDDAVSGSEDAQPKLSQKGRHKSLFGFLAHRRAPSTEQVPRLQSERSDQAATEGAEDTASSKSGSTVKFRGPRSDGASVRSGGSTSSPYFTYEEGEVDSVIDWNAKGSGEMQRRDTQVAPDNTTLNRQQTWTSSIASTTMQRTFSNPATTYPGHAFGSSAIPHPSAENEYLGFCKGAWRLQNGDRKGLNKCKDFRYSAQAGVYYLACSASKCAFAGHYNPNIIYDRVWPVESRGIKFRWPFLAKSHVQQKTVRNDIFAYQCIFCVYLGHRTPVMNGMDMYLDHINKEHRGRVVSEVILYKTGCINDRVADENEEFDINLFPLTNEEQIKLRKESNVDDLIISDLKRSDTAAKDSMFSNEPWNEGLSDFHYGGDYDYTAAFRDDFNDASGRLELEG